MIKKFYKPCDCVIILVVHAMVPGRHLRDEMGGIAGFS